MKKTFAIFLATLILLSGCGKNVISDESGENLNGDSPLFLSENEEIYNDVEAVRKKLEYSILKNLYDEAPFLELEEDIKSGDAKKDEAVFRLMEIISDYDVSHLYLNANDEELYRDMFPVMLTWFKEGLFVTDTDDSLKQYLGMKVVGIGGLSLEKFIDACAELFPFETDCGRKYVCENGLFPKFFSYLGLLNGDGTLSLKLLDSNQKEIDVFLKAMDRSKIQVASLFGEDVPKFYQSYLSNLNYCYETNEETGVMFLRYYSCSEDKSYSFEECFLDMCDVMEENGYNKLVFDLRFNGGGNRMIAREVLGKYAYRLQNVETAVLISGKTYSAGAQFVEDCMKFLGNVVIVGEETGQKIKNYTEVKTLDLPSLNCTLYYPTMSDNLTLLKERDKNAGGGIIPDFENMQSFEDFLKGVDTLGQNTEWFSAD